jgi:hypothetical protein
MLADSDVRQSGCSCRQPLPWHMSPAMMSIARTDLQGHRRQGQRARGCPSSDALCQTPRELRPVVRENPEFATTALAVHTTEPGYRVVLTRRASGPPRSARTSTPSPTTPRRLHPSPGRCEREPPRAAQRHCNEVADLVPEHARPLAGRGAASARDRATVDHGGNLAEVHRLASGLEAGAGPRPDLHRFRVSSPTPSQAACPTSASGTRTSQICPNYQADATTPVTAAIPGSSMAGRCPSPLAACRATRDLTSGWASPAGTDTVRSGCTGHGIDSLPVVWSEIAQRRMTPRQVVPADVSGDLDLGLEQGWERADGVHQLVLEPGEPRLSRSVIPAHANSSHRGPSVRLFERVEPLPRGVLLPRSLWTISPGGGWRRASAIVSASVTSPTRM